MMILDAGYDVSIPKPINTPAPMVVLNQVSLTGVTANNTQGTVNATIENKSMYRCV